MFYYNKLCFIYAMLSNVVKDYFQIYHKFSIQAEGNNLID